MSLVGTGTISNTSIYQPQSVTAKLLIVSVLVQSTGALRYMIMIRPIDDTASKMVKSGHFI